MYYGLKSFYQNHRRYVKSLDNYQLAGDKVSSPSSDCEPFAKDRKGNIYAPCGAIANSLFNGIGLVFLSMSWFSKEEFAFCFVFFFIKNYIFCILYVLYYAFE